MLICFFFFFQPEAGIGIALPSVGSGDGYKGQLLRFSCYLSGLSDLVLAKIPDCADSVVGTVTVWTFNSDFDPVLDITI